MASHLMQSQRGLKLRKHLKVLEYNSYRQTTNNVGKYLQQATLKDVILIFFVFFRLFHPCSAYYFLKDDQK